MRKDWLIKDLLIWTTRYFADRGMQESRLEAEILLAHVLHKDRVYLYTNYDKPVNGEERRIYRDFIKRRLEGEPVAYIIGKKEFMSLLFRVSPDVLIPRPDTELLVETALKLIQQGDINRICDVGTGSGAIAVSLAYYAPGSTIFAVDVSSLALSVARENADFHNVNVRFYEGDLLRPLSDQEPLDMIVANLPYLTRTQLEQADVGVRDFEPRLALVAEGDGLDIYRRLLPQAKQALRPGGYLLWEIDSDQTDAARNLVSDFAEVEALADYTGRNRLLKARRSYD